MSYRLIVLAAVLIGGLSAGTTLSAADLGDVYGMALDGDLMLAEARNRYQATHTRVAQGLSALLPSVNLQGSSARNAQAPAVAYSYADGFNSHGYGLNLSQNLLNFQAWSAFEAVRIGDRQALTGLALIEQQLIVRVATAYFSVLRSQRNLQSFLEEEEAAARILEQSEQTLAVGLNTVTDVLQSQSNFDLARVNRLLEENALAQQLEALTLITGQAPGPLADLAPTFAIASPEPVDLAEWEQLTSGNNLSVRVAELDFEARKTDVLTAKAAGYPRFDLSASYNYNAESSNPFSFFNNTASERTALSLNVTVPLFSGGLNSARKREAYYNRDASEDVLRHTRREALQSIRNAWRNVQTDVITVAAREQAVDSARSALQSTETGAQVGTHNIVDVVLAQRTLFQAERDHAAARYNYVLNTVNLKLAAGILNPRDVAELNTWLE
jgi:outer membrane protein